jgi:alkylated DNA repair dioxygenase AlkB
MSVKENNRYNLVDIGDGILYSSDFVENPDEVFSDLWAGLQWERRDSTPRLEYYTNKISVPYQYGRGRGVREYLPKFIHPRIELLRSNIEYLTESLFEVCFLNGYENQKDHLGWHADDSPEMDDNRPIGIISLGVAREIWFRPQDEKDKVRKLVLGHGSLCLMPPGFQDTHFHRIPKASFECGERISLTYRGYVESKN